MYRTSNYIPSFVNVIKPKRSLFSSLMSSNATKSIDTIITGAQKILNVYEKAIPIINQSKPMIDNIRTTFKVAKAFRKISNESSLEKAFDNLPDFEVEVKDTKDSNKVANPFYPWYTIVGELNESRTN